ncbi:type IVB secretion system protein IcmH/DotU [Dyella terrae]|uniref:type IVB secretion system protein IcmH/DotU n=1 Tax=Dyella terrae TaxID=522259 RepID=UPI001EFEE70C|nr:type IVB secretion system protein IcmH/DotU [Dyella terrae]
MNIERPYDDDPMRDATIVRPRQHGAPAASTPAPAPAPRPPAMEPERTDISEFLGGGMNPLVQAASPLLLLGVQLRHSAAPPNATHLREQAVVQVHKFEHRAKEAGISAQTMTAARYVLCTMLDEAVLSAPWGDQSGWSQKTLLVTFHGESYGGEKFFQILERLCNDFTTHIDLIELMYACLALGFAGRYQVEAGGRAKLADLQESLYRQIKAKRPPPADELAPHWRGIEDRRNPLMRYVPLWVVRVAAAAVLVGAFVYFHVRLNAVSAPLSAQAARIGLSSAVPPADTARPVAAHKTLKELLAAEIQAGQLGVDEQSDGKELLRLNAATMFSSGGVDVDSSQLPLLRKIAEALNQVPGRAIVVGHTDDQPVRSLKFKDNYELSAARAKAVSTILAQSLDNPARLESSGAGDSQPIARPPELPANRTRNRRVEILYLPGS